LFKYALGAKRPEPIGTVGGNLFGAAWAPDGKRLLLSRGATTSDVLLISLKASTAGR
jgi:hypothetical protein